MTAFRAEMKLGAVVKSEKCTDWDLNSLAHCVRSLFKSRVQTHKPVSDAEMELRVGWV